MYNKIFGREITIHTVIYGVYIRFWPTLCIYGIFGMEITIHTVIYGVCIRFWPTQLSTHASTVSTHLFSSHHLDQCWNRTMTPILSQPRIPDLNKASLLLQRLFRQSHVTYLQSQSFICRVGQNRIYIHRIYTPYMTVYLVISLPKILYIHRIYICLWPTLFICPNTSFTLPSIVLAQALVHGPGPQR